MAKQVTFPAVAKFGNATTNQAKALALAAIELVKAITAKDASADEIMATAKADFGYEARDDKGKSTWRTFAKKATRVAVDFASLPKAQQDSFLANERGSSLDSLFKALTGEENKVKAAENKAAKEAEAKAGEQALREEIMAELGGDKMRIITPAEMMLHLAQYLAERPISDMTDEEAGALDLLRDAINTACAAEVERLAA